MNNNVSLAYTSPYDNEANNNNIQALEMINAILPNHFNSEHFIILSEVQRGIDLLLNSDSSGQVIVYVKAGDINVRYSGDFNRRSN